MDKKKLIKPQKTKPNEYIERHGAMGFMILRLNRFAILGWVFGFVILIFFGLYFIIDKLQPVPVIAVDSVGRVLGTFEYLDASARTNDEIILTSKYFLDRYLSLNSNTIFQDNSEAVNMLDKDLALAKIKEVKSTGFLHDIKNANARSFNEYYEDNRKVAIIVRDGLNVTVRLRGNLVVTPENLKIFERPFDITLEIKIVPRNNFVTAGIKITNITGN